MQSENPVVLTLARQIREAIGAVLLLGMALAAALTSAAARQSGQAYAAVFLAAVALLLALVVGVTVVPRLVRRVNVELLQAVRFFRVTRRGAFVLTLLFLIGVATFNTGNNLLVLVLSMLLAAMLVSGIASNVVLHGLKISLNLPDSIYADKHIVLFLTLENLKKRLPSFALRLQGSGDDSETEHSGDFFVRETLFPYLSPGGRLTARLQCSFGRRGRFPVEGFRVRTDFPFGFFTRGRQLPAEGVITVYPARVDLAEIFALQPRLQGLEAYHRKGRGSGLFNIRDYQSGDGVRLVHWKSSAKLGRMMVKEFIREEDHPLEIVFSTFLPRQDAGSLAQFEKAVSYLASLVAYYGERNAPVHFRSGEFRRSASAPIDYTCIMDYLACVEPSARQLIDPSQVDSAAVLFTAGSGEGPWVVDYLTL